LCECWIKVCSLWSSKKTQHSTLTHLNASGI